MVVKKGLQFSAAILACTVLAAPSYAYLDPGTGSIILQSILAGIAVAMGVLRLYWYRLKAFFSGKTSESELSDSKDAEIRNES
jgi:hypothetical protein